MASPESWNNVELRAVANKDPDDPPAPLSLSAHL